MEDLENKFSLISKLSWDNVMVPYLQSFADLKSNSKIQSPWQKFLFVSAVMQDTQHVPATCRLCGILTLDQ
jgi:hypothetical protein